MFIIWIIGILMIGFGLFGIIKGKLPFPSRYNGVKKPALHSRIEGSAALLVGILLLFQCFMPMNTFSFAASVLVICMIAFVLEILFQVI